MNRENFIKVIPKPTNEDVILYDISLKELIDVDVPNEYLKLFPIFKEAKKDFSKLKEEIDVYKQTINQIFLYNPSWSEETYLQKLQEDMKTYSTLYGNIKRKEDEIKILQKKIEAINEKIAVQKVKEEKEREDKKANINDTIEECKINQRKCKDTIDIYRISFKEIEKQSKNLKSDLKTLKLSKQKILKGEYKCFCCGKEINKNEAGEIINKIELNIQEKENQLIKISEEKDKLKNTLNYYKDKLSKIKIELKNNINFRSNYKIMYIKKSSEILKLEGMKNELLNKITTLNETFKNEPQINSKKFLELKNRIEKYKISLENLKKIQSMKGNAGKKIKIYEQKKTKIDEMKTTLNKYLSFLNIYYKIYEQKASQYAGPDYKIKLFEIKNCEIIEILNIQYKGVEYFELSKKNKQIVDQNLIEKFSSDF